MLRVRNAICQYCCMEKVAVFGSAWQKRGGWVRRAESVLRMDCACRMVLSPSIMPSWCARQEQCGERDPFAPISTTPLTISRLAPKGRFWSERPRFSGDGGSSGIVSAKVSLLNVEPSLRLGRGTGHPAPKPALRCAVEAAGSSSTARSHPRCDRDQCLVVRGTGGSNPPCASGESSDPVKLTIR